MKLLIFLLSSLLNAQCPEKPETSENGAWKCSGNQVKDKCTFSCNSSYLLEGKNKPARCRCNKKNICTWKMKNIIPKCTMPTTTNVIYSTTKTTTLKTTTTKIVTTTEQPKESCPVLAFNSIQYSIIESAKNKFIAQIKSGSNNQLSGELSRWSVVIFFDQPVDNFNFEFHGMEEVEIRNNIIVLKSRGEDPENAEKSFQFEIFLALF